MRLLSCTNDACARPDGEPAAFTCTAILTPQSEVAFVDDAEPACLHCGEEARVVEKKEIRP